MTAFRGKLQNLAIFVLYCTRQKRGKREVFIALQFYVRWGNCFEYVAVISHCDLDLWGQSTHHFALSRLVLSLPPLSEHVDEGAVVLAVALLLARVHLLVVQLFLHALDGGNPRASGGGRNQSKLTLLAM